MKVDKNGKLTLGDKFKLFVPLKHNEGEVQLRLVKDGVTSSSVAKCGVYLLAITHHAPFTHSFSMFKSDKKTPGGQVLIQADWQPLTGPEAVLANKSHSQGGIKKATLKPGA